MLDLLNINLLSLLFLTGTTVTLIVVLSAFVRRHRSSGFQSNGRIVSPDLQLGAVPTYRQMLGKMSNELTRVRRYNRPLTLVVLKIESDQLLVDLKRNLVAETGNGSVKSYSSIMQTIQLVFSLVGSILRESLRESDVASYDVANNQYIVLLPESDRGQATQTVRRLKKLLFKRTAGHLVEGIAEFPKDGLIIEDLVKVAMKACRQRPDGKLDSGSKSKMKNKKPDNPDQN